MDRAGLACFGLVGNADQQGSRGSPHKSYGEFLKKSAEFSLPNNQGTFPSNLFFSPSTRKGHPRIIFKKKTTVLYRNVE